MEIDGIFEYSDAAFDDISKIQTCSEGDVRDIKACRISFVVLQTFLEKVTIAFVVE